MSEHSFNSDDAGAAQNCQSLWDICTPALYENSPFRITGLHAGAGIRDIKRRINELREAIEFDAIEEEFTHAYAPSPLPDIGQIQDASRLLEDPEKRIAYELFWFWPRDWEQSNSDPSITALVNGDVDAAVAQWSEWIEDADEEVRIIGQHNIAIYYHIWLLGEESRAARHELEDSEHDELDAKWRESFEWWEELADSEAFWSILSSRIRMLDDPRVTTGFSRRMRAAFPESFDRINALIAVRLIESGRYERAELHVDYMDLTHSELDDVPRTIADVARPLRRNIRKSIDRVKELVSGQKKVQLHAIQDVIKTTEKPRAILARLLKKLEEDDDESGELADELSELCRSAAIKIGNQEEDWKQSLALIEQAISLASSKDQKEQCEKNRDEVMALIKIDHPIKRQISKIIEDLDKTNDYIEKVTLLNAQAAPLLRSLRDSAGRTSEPFAHSCDEIAGALRDCSIGLFNLNMENFNKGLERAVEFKNAGLNPETAMPTAACAILWLCSVIHDNCKAMVHNSEFKKRISKDYEAIKDTADFIDKLLSDNIINIKQYQSKWDAAGVLPMPWMSIVRPPATQSKARSTATHQAAQQQSSATTSSSTEGCFIATAVYGSYNHPQVLLLRGYRDHILANHTAGKLLIWVYYKYSPKIAEYIRRSPARKVVVRHVVEQIVALIRRKHHALFGVTNE